MKYNTASKEELRRPQWGGDGFEPRWQRLVPDLDKLVMMYWGDLLTFEEIAKKAGEDWWVVKELFKQHDIPRMSTADRARFRRQELFEQLNRLHRLEGRTLDTIYNDLGYSPRFVRKVLKEGDAREQP